MVLRDMNVNQMESCTVTRLLQISGLAGLKTDFLTAGVQTCKRSCSEDKLRGSNEMMGKT